MIYKLKVTSRRVQPKCFGCTTNNLNSTSYYSPCYFSTRETHKDGLTLVMATIYSVSTRSYNFSTACTRDVRNAFNKSAQIYFISFHNILYFFYRTRIFFFFMKKKKERPAYMLFCWSASEKHNIIIIQSLRD